nr:sensor histidine kinase [Kineococcus siccus]
MTVTVFPAAGDTPWARSAPAWLVVAVPLVAALVAASVNVLALRTALHPGEGPPRTVALLGLALVAYVPSLLLGVDWLAWTAVLACFLVVVLPLRVAAALYVAGLLLQLGLWRLAGEDWRSTIFAGVSYVATSFLLAVLLRALTTYQELERARAELALAEVLRERVRVSRDLHDLLGRNLTAVSLKVELARRHQRAGREDQLRTELDEVLALSHAAATDLRALVTGYRALSLESELGAARRLLGDAGIGCEVDADPSALTAEAGPEVSEVAAWVVREATTNVLKHARASACRISAHVVDGELRLVVSNDGADAAGVPAQTGNGSGLLGVRERVRSVGGRVDVRSAAGTFELSCTVPLARPGLQDGRPTGRPAGGRTRGGRHPGGRKVGSR